MPYVNSRPLRARNAEEKKRRRADILKAAEHLWLNTPYGDLSMSQVAREAQLAKGTLYLYFDTKEELFLALLTEQLEAWLKDLLADLESGRCITADDLTDLIVARVLPQASLRRMLVLLNTTIDTSVSADQSQNFRRLLMRYVAPIVELMPFERSVNLRILMHVYSLSTGWQLAASGPTFGDQPEFLALSTQLYPRPRFEDEFPLSLRAAIRAIVEQGPQQAIAAPLSAEASL